MKAKDLSVLRRPLRFGFPYLRELLTLTRRDRNRVPRDRREIRLFAVVRNEQRRLPWFLRYYRELGVDRFFFVDNGSDDGTLELLLAEHDVHVYATTSSYKASQFGCLWRERLFRRYAEGHWCLAMDADEMLVYPDVETKPLPVLCSELEAEGALGMAAVWLQMYSDRPVRNTTWEAHDDPLALCPYFDADSAEAVPHPKLLGWQWSLHKAPLFFRSRRGPRVWIGQHRFLWRNKDYSSATRGAVLHFKFTADFFDLCVEELRRQEHWRAKKKHGTFHAKMVEEPDLCLMHEGSVRYAGSAMLREMGILRSSHDPVEVRFGVD